jgi:multidrug efflux pump subunit AcrA (membrane-fusion protein)
VNFKGVINFISPEADSRVRTFLAEIIVNNNIGLIRAGIMGNAKILRNVHKDAIMIPINTLIETQNGRIVFVLKEGNVVEERKIEMMEGTDLMVQVKGLSAGEKIISKGQYDLINGEQVNVTGEYSSEIEEVGS